MSNSTDSEKERTQNKRLDLGEQHVEEPCNIGGGKWGVERVELSQRLREQDKTNGAMPLIRMCCMLTLEKFFLL